MKIKDFLKNSIAEKLSLREQEKFLRSKTEISAQELAEVVKFLQSQMSEKFKFPGAIDVCGTGGSGLERINTSTISAFILASLGVKVAKHGNKAASGRFGSFDLIEKLGTEFGNKNLALLFAPKFHPIMKHFAPIRKKIGKPTFFNLIGPLINPANVKKQIIGTSFRGHMDLIAETCKLLGKKHIYVVSAENGLDEVTLAGKTYIVELKNGKISKYTISPKDFGVASCKFKEIKGGNANFNTKIAKKILKGKCTTRHKDLVLINSALALKLAGKTKTLEQGYEMAKNSLPSMLSEIVENKRKEVAKKTSQRDFLYELQKPGLTLIAEIKKASPSAGEISNKKLSPAQIAEMYEKSGVRIISVLCDKKYFGGSLEDMKKVYENTNYTPILCKDFIIDECQIYEAGQYGASAILLIAAILSGKQIENFIKTAKKLKMSAICEVHTEKELKKVLKTSAKIIGINNRDLTTFEIDLNITKKLAKLIPKDKIIVSMSGINSKNDIKKLPKNINGILVGTSIMTSKNPQEKIKELCAKPLIKICGIRKIKEAEFCENHGVDFIGLNFAPNSKRKITLEKAQKICNSVQKIKKVGIFQNQNIKEVNKITKKLSLDYIQIAGNETASFIKKCTKPVIKTISIKTAKDLQKAKEFIPHIAYLILDSASPGSGRQFDTGILENFKKPYILAGGLTLQNIKEILRKTSPIGIDIASGVETNGKIDLKKIQSIFNQIQT